MLRATLSNGCTLPLAAAMATLATFGCADASCVDLLTCPIPRMDGVAGEGGDSNDPGGIPGQGGAAGNPTAGDGGTTGIAGSGGVCTADTCGDDCVDTQNDEKNCGYCGHDCLGGTCTDGTCQPFALARFAASAAPIALAVDHSFAYFSSAGDIRRVAVNGGTPTFVAKGKTAVASGLAIDASNVYWSDKLLGKIYRAPLSGVPDGEPGVIVAEEQNKPTSIAVLGDSVFWGTTDSFGGVFKAPITGLQGDDKPITIAELQKFIGAIAVTPSAGVYWTNSTAAGTVMQAPLSGVPNGGSPARIAEAANSFPVPIAVGPSGVYWASDAATGKLYRTSHTGTTKGEPEEVIASSQGEIVAIALDEDFVYWTDRTNGAVLQAPLAGGFTAPVATAQNQPAAIAVTSDAVYWTTAESIMKVAK